MKLNNETCTCDEPDRLQISAVLITAHLFFLNKIAPLTLSWLSGLNLS